MEKEILKITGSPGWTGAITRKLNQNKELKQTYENQFKPLLTQNLNQNIKTIENSIHELEKQIKKQQTQEWYQIYSNTLFGLIDTTLNTGIIATQMLKYLQQKATIKNIKLNQLLIQLDQALESDVGQLIQSITNLEENQKIKIKQITTKDENQLKKEIIEIISIEKFNKLKIQTESQTPATLIYQSLHALKENKPKPNTINIEKYTKLKKLQNKTHYLGIEIGKKLGGNT